MDDSPVAGALPTKIGTYSLYFCSDLMINLVSLLSNRYELVV